MSAVAMCVRRSRPGTVRGGQPGAVAGHRRADSTEVREWANAQGIEVKDRGRVPADLVARFKTATLK
jgi:hypothetical protein